MCDIYTEGLLQVQKTLYCCTDSKSFGSPWALVKPHIFGYFVLGSAKSEAENKTPIQQDVQRNVRTSARNSGKADR